MLSMLLPECQYLVLCDVYKCCRGQLYCALTCQVMQAKLETVKKHMSGKRFAAAKGAPSLCDALAPSGMDA